mmetsp:Transcript_49298/g.89081  ORF Transcript_49298/g.89081 Transcript_49298/m.89081 type:complete len:201 (+) Transcript_49298:759-1361(+)
MCLIIFLVLSGRAASDASAASGSGSASSGPPGSVLLGRPAGPAAALVDASAAAVDSDEAAVASAGAAASAPSFLAGLAAGADDAGVSPVAAASSLAAASPAFCNNSGCARSVYFCWKWSNWLKNIFSAIPGMKPIRSLGVSMTWKRSVLRSKKLKMLYMSSSEFPCLEAKPRSKSSNLPSAMMLVQRCSIAPAPNKDYMR